MKHATDKTFDQIPELLEAIAHHVPPLKEKKRGTFYHKSSAFLHFHEDPAGIFADLKINKEWVRYDVTHQQSWPQLLRHIEDTLQ